MNHNISSGIHSFSFRDAFEKDPGFTIDHALEISAGMGFRTMEVMTGVAGEMGHIGTDTLDGLTALIGRAEKLGIRIHCYASYNDFAFTPNEAWRLDNIEYVKQWLRLAGDTGVPNIRMLTGYHIEGVDRAQLEDLVLRGIEECAVVAEASGVNMAIENHSSVFESGLEIMEIIQRVGSPRLTTCPDPSNGYKFFEPDSPDSERNAVYENVRVMAPRATNSHLKIKGITSDGKLEGWDLDRLIGIYQEAGYNGPITFESIAEGDLLAPLAEAKRIVEEAIERGRSGAK